MSESEEHEHKSWSDMTMDERREIQLMQQKAVTMSGTVLYNRGGFDVKSLPGFIVVGNDMLVVFADPAQLIGEQKRIMIPMDKVHEIEVDEL